MILNLIRLLASKMSCASLLGAQGIFVPEKALLLEATQGQMQDLGTALQGFFNGLLDMFIETVNSWVYIISKYILMFIDFCQVITYKIAGIDTDLEKIVDMPIFRLILNETVLNLMGSIIILSLVILVVATILAIIKSEYKIAMEDKGDKKSVAYKVFGKSCISLFLMIITPFILIIAVIFSSVVMSSINNVLNSNETQNATIGGTLFMTSSYHANKYRLYAADGRRIPVILNFDDPYESGLYEYISSEELYEIYENWNGEEIYDDFANKNFLTFNETIVYKNGKLYNSNSYSDYERFVSTAEQYNVMADFIDYAMSHEIKFYIKDSKDNQIDWDRTSSEIKITEGVYNEIDNSFSITYTDASNLSPYEDYYTITFETGTASADTPIETAVSTISLILGLNTLVYSSTSEGLVSASNILNNSALQTSATEVEQILTNIMMDASSNSSLEFRLLERVKGSINVVRWQTEKANYDGKDFTVYELKKIVRNEETGNNDVRATLKVAKKDDSLNSRYFVLKEEKNGEYYDYTNIEVDYYNNGGKYQDTLTPIFKKATWPEKLYNDLMVIYSDIDFDSYIDYDNWADELGEYFKVGGDVTSDKVSSFATTLIHPLGLIMGELFLGLAIEDENGEPASFSFTSQYLDDIINSLAISLTGQYDYKNVVYQIKTFMSLFNNQFASVIESLKDIEGFDIYGTDELSVQGYVYKAYLASIMLSTDYGKYLYDISYNLLTAEKLIELIEIPAGQITYDENGNPVYEIVKVEEGDGEYVELLFGDIGSSRAVYNRNGKKVYAVNGRGILNFEVVNNFIEANVEEPGDAYKNYLLEYFIPRTNSNYIIIEDEEVSKNLILKSVLGSDLGLPASENFNLSYYAVYSNVQNKYIPAYELFFGPYEKYLEAKTEDLEWFGTYFEPYFSYDASNGGVYVYEPANGDTSQDETYVNASRWTTLIISNFQESYKRNGELTDVEAFTSYIIEQLGRDSIIDIAGKDETFANYEVEKVLKTTSGYLTYDRLPKVYQDFISNMIVKIEKDVEAGQFDEPFYLQFIKEYKENQPNMRDIMNSSIISSKTAADYQGKYYQMLEDIDYYNDLITYTNSNLLKQYYIKQRDKLQTRVDKLKKYNVIYGIENYASTLVSSSFTVVVNGHAYNVSQGLSQRQLLETILGNNLTYTSMLGKLKNKTEFSKLDKLDQQSYDQLSAFSKYYIDEVERLISGTVDSCALFKGDLNEHEIEIVENLYRTYTGEYKSFSNKILKVAKDKQERLDTLNALVHNLNKILVNYESGYNITRGLDGIGNNEAGRDKAYALLYEIVKATVGDDEKLFYVEDDYEGLIADDLSSFSLLREFLKGFGDLCFDLERKSNLKNIGKPDGKDFLSYVDQFMEVLNKQLGSVDLGTSTELLTILKSDSNGNIGVEMDANGDVKNILDKTNFRDYDAKIKEYFYILYDYYGMKIENYDNELKLAQDTKEYAQRYIKGRYAMQSNSFIYETGLKDYLNWFRYNVVIDDDSSTEENDAISFIKKYIYSGYLGYNGEEEEIFNHDERVEYYNLYLDAFSTLTLGKDGLYFEELNTLQQKVILDMKEFYALKYENFVKTNKDIYSLNKESYELVKSFIFNPDSVLKDELKELFKQNLNVLNLYNMLDYVGLDFKVDKSLNEYRLDAINSLISFKERAGESGASIQARYLTLLYIACADYAEGASGDTIIQISSSTKATILDLAGLKDMPEEQLVGLAFEITEEETIADEKYGSVFIICTYNSETKMFEPFVFASRSDGKGTPHTSYYSSCDGEVCYYPVVAKGVIGADGLPTAIREVNGYIEFYRESVKILNPAELNLEMYYVSVEEVAINYNPINLVVNGLSKLFTGKTAAEHMIEAFPAIVTKENFKFCYGATENTAWHLENGGFEINYMFYADTGIAMNCLYDASKLNGLILVVGTLILAFALVRAMFGVIGNLYELAILIIIYPGVFAISPLTNDAQKNWRKSLIDKLLIMLSYVVAINGFFLILNLLQRLDIKLVLSETSVAQLNDTFVFGLFDVTGLIGSLMTLAMFLVAAVLLKTLPDLFSKMLKTSDVIDNGDKVRKTVKTNIEEASYLSSGYAIDDMISARMDSMRGLPLVGSEARQVAQDKKQIKQNKLAVKSYEQQLKAKGISDDVTAKAVKAYEASLNRQLEAERERRNERYEARIARINKHKVRIKEKEKKDKQVTCPKCKAVYTSKKKTKQCKYCGHKFK